VGDLLWRSRVRLPSALVGIASPFVGNEKSHYPKNPRPTKREAQDKSTGILM
jgi:hypothetical protein